MDKKKIILFVSAAIPILLVLFFLSFPERQEKKDDKLKVAASIFPIYDITRQIAGDKVEVVQILPNNQSEHTYSPTIRDKERVMGSDVALLIGLGIDDWCIDLLDDDTLTYTLYKDINLIAAEELAIEEEGVIEDDHEEYEIADPHYWMSIQNGIIITDNIKNILSEMDPDNSDYYETQANQYKAQLAVVYDKYQQSLHELEKRELVTFHEAFNYLARELGLNVVATIEPFAGKEPSLAYIQKVGKIIEEYDIRVLYKEPQLSDVSLEPLKNAYDVEIRTLDPLGGVEDRDSFIKLLEYNINIIFEDLNENSN